MNVKMNIAFKGTVSELVTFMETTFKDPESLSLKVEITNDLVLSKSMRSAIIRLQAMSHISEEMAIRAIEQALPLAVNKIQAIKMIREHSGLGLKEAKDFVECLEFTSLHQ